MAIKILLYILFFLSGLLTGNYLNFIIYKIPGKLRILKDYKKCPNCGSEISLFTRFPLVTLIAKSRKVCLSCNNDVPILSYQKGIVEILTALLFVINYVIFDFRLYGLYLINGIILCSVLIVVSFIDLEYRIIPNKIALPSTLIGISINTIIFILEDYQKSWFPLAYCLGAFTFMLVIYLIYPKGMGFGDVKLGMMLGAFLVKNVIAGLFLGFFITSISGLILIIFKKKKLKEEIPFGPFISAGSIMALFAGEFILKWYTGFI